MARHVEFVSPESTISPLFSSAVAIVSPSSPIVVAVVVSGGESSGEEVYYFCSKPPVKIYKTENPV